MMYAVESRMFRRRLVFTREQVEHGIERAVACELFYGPTTDGASIRVLQSLETIGIIHLDRSGIDTGLVTVFAIEVEPDVELEAVERHVGLLFGEPLAWPTSERRNAKGVLVMRRRARSWESGRVKLCIGARTGA